MKVVKLGVHGTGTCTGPERARAREYSYVPAKHSRRVALLLQPVKLDGLRTLEAYLESRSANLKN